MTNTDKTCQTCEYWAVAARAIVKAGTEAPCTRYPKNANSIGHQAVDGCGEHKWPAEEVEPLPFPGVTAPAKKAAKKAATKRAQEHNPRHAKRG